jgi:cyclase
VTSDHYRFEQVAPHAWAAVAIDAGAAVGNAGIADLGGRALVVDCGFTPGAAGDLRAAAEEAAGPVERLFITHADFDHYGGAQAFTDVPILAAETTAETIREAGPGRIAEIKAEMETYLAELDGQGAPEWEREQCRRIVAEVPHLELTPPTETFAGKRELGGATAIDFGATHTTSDSVVWLPEDRVLFTGDLVGVGSHLNLTRGHPPGNWLVILEELSALGPEHVVPGHGPPAGADALESVRTYITTVVELAATPGAHDIPAEYADWDFPRASRRTWMHSGRGSVRPWRITAQRRTATASPRCTADEGAGPRRLRPGRARRPRTRGHAREARRRHRGGEGRGSASRRLSRDLRPRLPELRLGEVPRRLGRPPGQGRVRHARARVPRGARAGG